MCYVGAFAYRYNPIGPFYTYLEFCVKYCKHVVVMATSS